MELVDSRRPVGKRWQTRSVFHGLSTGERECAQAGIGAADCPQIHGFNPQGFCGRASFSCGFFVFIEGGAAGHSRRLRPGAHPRAARAARMRNAGASSRVSRPTSRGACSASPQYTRRVCGPLRHPSTDAPARRGTNVRRSANTHTRTRAKKIQGQAHRWAGGREEVNAEVRGPKTAGRGGGALALLCKRGDAPASSAITASLFACERRHHTIRRHGPHNGVTPPLRLDRCDTPGRWHSASVARPFARAQRCKTRGGRTFNSQEERPRFLLPQSSAFRAYASAPAEPLGHPYTFTWFKQWCSFSCGREESSVTPQSGVNMCSWGKSPPSAAIANLSSNRASRRSPSRSA